VKRANALNEAIHIASRASPLARAQVEEFKQEILKHHPSLLFSTVFVETTGDIDQKTSLRTLDKTDFFTKELDGLLLEKKCRVAVHSAKDLPDPLPAGLAIAAITRGVDPSDSLVMKQGITLHTLPKSPIIATSSVRREEALRQIIPNARFIDLRGIIQKRLQVLEEGKADGVILAEAALIRLGLTHLNRIKLPGATVPFQGQLAVVVRDDDSEMKALFAPINHPQGIEGSDV
jgi:hydroxymethylbilane synthase